MTFIVVQHQNALFVDMGNYCIEPSNYTLSVRAICYGISARLPKVRNSPQDRHRVPPLLFELKVDWVAPFHPDLTHSLPLMSAGLIKTYDLSLSSHRRRELRYKGLFL